MERATRGLLPVGRQRLIGGLFLVSGAGLVVHVAVGLPLWVTVPGGLVLVAALLGWVGAFAGLDLRPILRSGVAAGATATLAYDLSRVAVVELFGLRTRPFEAWWFFGRALVGDGTSVTAHWITGAPST